MTICHLQTDEIKVTQLSLGVPVLLLLSCRERYIICSESTYIHTLVLMKNGIAVTTLIT